MATITVKNVPDKLYDSFKALAQKNRRSINSEVIHWLEYAVNQDTRDPEEVLERARAVRERLNFYVTSEELRTAIEEGRP